MPAAAQTAADPGSRIMFVFDGSNSMWGQIEGRPKIDIARDAFSQALLDLPLDAEAGLTVYGHRRRGDCSDIELVVPLAPGAQSLGAMASAVAGITPRGKTPLTASVRQAADAMKYQEVPATVVVITDGIESCDADPCALSRELERLGVDFTAHVVGFGLSDDDRAAVACIAEETGGEYFDAGNADALADALTTVVQVEPEPAPLPEPEPEPVVAALPETISVRMLLLEGDTQGARAQAVGTPKPADPVAHFLDPNGQRIEAAGASFADKPGEFGIAINDSFSLRFSPTVAGDYALVLTYPGFTHEVPFTVTPDMPRLIDVTPQLTLVTATLTDREGAPLPQNLVYARFCPPEVIDSNDARCIKREGATTLVPPGTYRVSAFRWYDWRVNGNRIVEVGPPRTQQTIPIAFGDDAGEATGLPETTPEEPTEPSNDDPDGSSEGGTDDRTDYRYDPYDPAVQALDLEAPGTIDLSSILPATLDTLPPFTLALDAEPLADLGADVGALAALYGAPAHILRMMPVGAEADAPFMTAFFEANTRDVYALRAPVRLGAICDRFYDDLPCDGVQGLPTAEGVFQVTRAIGNAQLEGVIRFPNRPETEVRIEQDYLNGISKFWVIRDGALVGMDVSRDTRDERAAAVPIVAGVVVRPGGDARQEDGQASRPVEEGGEASGERLVVFPDPDKLPAFAPLGSREPIIRFAVDAGGAPVVTLAEGWCGRADCPTETLPRSAELDETWLRGGLALVRSERMGRDLAFSFAIATPADPRLLILGPAPDTDGVDVPVLTLRGTHAPTLPVASPPAPEAPMGPVVRLPVDPVHPIPDLDEAEPVAVIADEEDAGTVATLFLEPGDGRFGYVRFDAGLCARVEHPIVCGIGEQPGHVERIVGADGNVDLA
ncbi:MAG: VWA domain-containing protein, partial [Pseudomonadota bacterium]